MYSRWIIISLLILCNIITLTISAQTPHEWKEISPGKFNTLTKIQVDQIINPLIRNGTYTGMVVILVDRNGSAVYGYGVKEQNIRTPVDNQTIFGIGSVTKTFTGILLADAQIHGGVNISAPIRAYIPTDVTAPSLNGKEITLENIATHTSGLPNVPDSFYQVNETLPVEDQKEESFRHYATTSAEEIYSWLSNLMLTREPGSEWEYSNAGTAIAGQIIASQENNTYEGLLKSKITDPLGMNDTTITLSADQEIRRATGYRAYAPDRDQAEEIRFTDFWAATGGIYSTGDDMAVYLASILGLADSPLTTAIHETRQPRAIRTAGPPEIQQGLFWDIVQSSEGKRIYLKAGETNGYQADIALIPDQQIGVVILANTAYLDEEHVQTYAIDLLEKMNGKPLF